MNTKEKIIAGVDEVGRGSLIGPVFAAAVIFKKNISVTHIKDSKKLSSNRRILFSKYIKKNSFWSVGTASLIEIEKLNILNASMLAMKRAIWKLKIKPSLVFIDGNKIPNMKNYNLRSIIKGDQKIKQISAASIIAKVSRDISIKKLSKKFINYEWQFNMGYGTKSHIKAIKKYGVTKYHRKNFNPVHKILSLKKI